MGKCSKIGGMVFGKKGGGNFDLRKCKRHKCHPKMNLYRKFYPNWTMGKCSQIEGMGGIRGRGNFEKKMKTS